MSAVVVPFEAYKPNPQRPWLNDELAELYRAVDILSKAGLSIETDMGISDEGDPWFAFCRADTGEVIVHCARISGMFVATSIAIDRTFQGANFREVINSIVHYEPLKLPLTTTSTRLFLHPVMVLAAFVATGLLFSKNADAHDLHAAIVSLTAHEGTGGSKNLVTLKAAFGDFLQSFAWPAGTAKITSTGALSETEAAGSLAALMAAAMTLVSAAVDISGIEEILPSAAAVIVPVETHATVIGQTDIASVALAAIDHTAQAAQVDGSPAYQTWVHALLDGSLKLADLTPVLREATTAATAFGSTVESAVPSHVSDTQHTSAAAVVISDHLIPHLTVTHAAVVSPISETGTDLQAADPSQPFDLSKVSSVATAILVGSADTQPNGDPLTILKSGAKHPQADGSSSDSGTKGASLTPGGDNSAGQSKTIAEPAAHSIDAGNTVTNVPPDAPAPAMIYLTIDDPTAGLAQLQTYAETNHSIKASTITPLSELAAAVAFYNADLSHPARLLVFDSHDIRLPFFEFTKGVLMVDDHELGINPSADTLASATTVYLSSGGTMKLLGVIDTGQTHIT